MWKFNNVYKREDVMEDKDEKDEVRKDEMVKIKRTKMRREGKHDNHKNIIKFKTFLIFKFINISIIRKSSTFNYNSIVN